MIGTMIYNRYSITWDGYGNGSRYCAMTNTPYVVIYNVKFRFSILVD